MGMRMCGKETRLVPIRTRTSAISARIGLIWARTCGKGAAFSLSCAAMPTALVSVSLIRAPVREIGAFIGVSRAQIRETSCGRNP